MIGLESTGPDDVAVRNPFTSQCLKFTNGTEEPQPILLKNHRLLICFRIIRNFTMR